MALIKKFLFELMLILFGVLFTIVLLILLGRG